MIFIQFALCHELTWSTTWSSERLKDSAYEMAGRFFATGDTDTESSSESSDEEIPKANLGAIRLY